MSNEEPIASPIGHGATGFRAGLRDWYQLSGETERQPQTFVEVRPGIVVAGWAPVNIDEEVGDDGYVASLPQPRWDGVPLDIVAVDTERMRLSRAADALDCAATLNSYYYDPIEQLLYINVIPADVPVGDAADTATIVARPGILIGTDAVTLPTFGPDLLVNGGFDDGGVAGWQIPSGLATTVPTFDPAGNDRCLLLTSHEPSTFAAVRQDVQTISGQLYCFSGAYISGTNGARVTLADGGTGANVVGLDGRSYGAPAGADLIQSITLATSDPDSERALRRRFCWYFVARTSSTRIILEALAGTSEVRAQFDSVTLRRIYSWQHAQPLLPAGGAPLIDDGREDNAFGAWRVGQAQFRVNNDDGAMGTLLGAYDFAGAEVVFRHGGRFADGGEEITPEHLRSGFVGRVRELTLEESGVMFRCEDTRGVALAMVPERRYSRDEFPELDPRYDDAARPLAFGHVQDVPPVRIGTDGAIGGAALGRYEVADVNGVAYGIVVEDSRRPARAWLYLDDGAAGRNDVTLRSDVTDHLAWQPQNGQFTLIKSCKPVALGELFFSVKVDGGPQIDVLLTPSQQETIIQTPTATTGVNNWGPTPSTPATDALSGIVVEGDGATAWSASTTGKRRLEVSFDPTPGISAAVNYVELRARVQPVDPYDPETFPPATAKLYVDPGATGTRYYATTFLENPHGLEWVDIVFKWTEDPASPGTLLDDAWNNAARFGIEFEPGGGSGGYLQCDLFQRFTRRISANAPTAAAPGVRSPSQTAEALAAAINAAAAVTDVTCTYNEVTRLFTIAKAAGSLELLSKTGRSPNGWEALRFASNVDHTGALSYTSVDPYYTAPDDLDVAVLRVDFIGAADDGAGHFTGTPNAPVERGPDVLRYLLEERLRVPRDHIVDGTFAAVRAVRPGAVSIYLAQPVSFGTVAVWVEAHDRADLTIDGTAYRYDIRRTTRAPQAPLVYDDQILGLTTSVSLENVVSAVRVSYAPGSQVGRGTMPAIEAPVIGVRARYGSSDRLEIECASASISDAEALRASMAALLSRAPRVYELVAYGDVAALRVGEVFGLRATAGVIADATGSLDVDIRVVRRRVNAETMTIEIVGVEVTGVAEAQAIEQALPLGARGTRPPWSPHLIAPWHRGMRHKQ